MTAGRGKYTYGTLYYTTGGGYSTVQYCIVLYCTVLYITLKVYRTGTVQYSVEDGYID